MQWLGWGGGSTNQVPQQPSGAYAVGDLVEYFSASSQTWIPAKVLQVNPSGTYNLDCKPEVTPDKIRPRGGGGASLESTTWGGSSSSKQPVGTGAGTQPSGTYAVGDMVEYFSASTQTWIPAKVVQVNPSGTYNLDCKLDVSADKIRPRGGMEFNVGDTVEYYSATQNTWIPAKVLQVNASKGNYNLDCKPEVLPDKIRAPQRGGAPAGTTGGNAQAAGSQGGVWGALSNFSAWGASAPSAAVPRHLTSGTQTAPVQLLRVQKSGGKWLYEVCPEGASMMERYGARRIAVISICGLYRTGKSYLLNLLLERVQKGLPLFQVGNSTNACTEGLWLWGSVDADDQRSPLLAFLDCEGFGSTTSDKTRDAQLMTLCALLSSVLVLNTKGALNENLFNALALVCRFAEHIEERGNEANRPVLLWVLRDFMLELLDASGKPTTPDDYLEQALHAAPTANGDYGRTEGAREVRQSLLRFFSHRLCSTLVRPANEEADLQRLDRMPYKQLRSEFRAGVEALRQQLVSAALANPKSVGGQPITCFAFVALLKQFVASINERKALSVKGAWETVQHTACGGLADELRDIACKALRVLQQGGELPGGAKLPLSDEALRGVLQGKRHELKKEWEERAVGDEAVRKEYWQELKVSLAMEEKVVQSQNKRIADEQLLKSLTGWQDWLDDEQGPWADGERIINSTAALADRAPASSLLNHMRQSMECAGRRVMANRHKHSATLKQSDEEKQKALAWGKEAAAKEGKARTELQQRLNLLEEAQERLRQLEDNHSGTKAELEARQAEMEAAKGRYEAQLREVEEAHSTHKRELEGKHTELQAAHGETQGELRRREQECQNLEMQLGSIRGELGDARSQVEGLMTELEAARGREHELKAVQRQQAEREASLKASLDEARGQAAKDNAERMASERLARTAADTAGSEKRALEVELEQARSDADSYKEQLAIEKAALKDENEKTRTEHVKLVEEIRKRLEEERKVHQDAMLGEKSRLLDREKNTGVLEGQVQVLSTENSHLKDQMAELQERLREVERERGQHAEERSRLKDDLEKTKVEHDAKLKEQVDKHERAMEAAREAEAAKPKCGCSLM